MRIANSIMIAALLWCAGVRLLNGQILPRLQAYSEQEFDAYLEVEETRDPELCFKFVKDWPNSELLPRVLEVQFEAYVGRGELPQALAAGRQALLAFPDNLTVQAQLAGMLAQSGKLAEARQRANRVLNTLETFRRPRQTNRQTWLSVKQRLQSDAHAALGIIAYREGNLRTALAEFEHAVRIRRPPDPAQQLRLGRLYKELGRLSEARAQFETLRNTANQEAFRKLAQQALDSLPAGHDNR